MVPNGIAFVLHSGYREKIEEELRTTCKDIMNVLDNNLLPAATTGESKV